MKVLLSENQLKTLIKEDLGVSRASLAYSNLIYQVLEPYAKEYIENKKPFSLNIIIGPDVISKIYQSSMDDFIDLPVEKIEIGFSTMKLPPKSLTQTFKSGGQFETLDKKSYGGSYLKQPSLELPKYVLEEITQVVYAKFKIHFDLGNEFTDELKDEALYDLRDTILHECNHLLEAYKRAESGAKEINATFSWVGGKNFNVNKEIFKVYQEFLNLIYYSEPYEVNAMSQEALSKTSRMTFDEFKKTKFWRDSEIMKSFDADIMFERLVNKINEVSPDKLVSIVQNLYKWFINDYYRWLKVYGETPSKQIEKTQGLYDLMKLFQKKINKAGNKLQRNYARLYTLELEK